MSALRNALRRWLGIDADRDRSDKFFGLLDKFARGEFAKQAQAMKRLHAWLDEMDRLEREIAEEDIGDEWRKNG